MSQCIIDNIHNLTNIFGNYLYFWGTQHIFNVFFVKNVDIIQSVSGSCFRGCESNGGHALGFIFVQALSIHIHVRGKGR